MSGANPYLDLIRNDGEQTLRQSLLTAVDKNPDAEAGLQALARQFALPVEAVRDDPETVRRRAALDGVDYASLLKWRPLTANLLADPQRAAIAHDDIDNLSSLESLLNSFKRGVPALQSVPQAWQVFNQAAGLDQLDSIDQAAARGETVHSGELGVLAESYAGLQTPADRLKFRDFYTPRMQAGLSDSAARLAALQSRRQAIPLPAVVDKVLRAPDWGTAWSEAAKEPLKLLAALGPESLVQSGPGVLAAIPAGMVAGPLGVAGAIGANSALVDYAWELLGNLQTAGVDVTDAAAIRLALQEPASRAKFSLQAAKHAGVVGLFDAFSGGLAGKNLASTWLKGGLAGRRWPADMANLGLQLPIQAGLGAAGEAGGEWAAGQAIQPGQVLAEAFAELFAAPSELAGAAASRLGARRAQAKQAERQAVELERINQVVAASRVLRRNPQMIKDFAAAALAQSERENLHIDAHDLFASGVAEQVVNLLPEVARQLPAALALGGEITVPFSRYVSQLAATPFAPSLTGHWRVGGTAFSGAKGLLYQQQRDAVDQAESERLAAGPSETAETAPALAGVKAAVLQQLQRVSPFSAEVNGVYAELHAAFYATQAQRFGVSPAELFQFMRAGVASEAADGQQFEQPMGGSERPAGDDVKQSQGQRGAFSPHSRTISLFPKADLSTFLHESGHLFLEIQFDLTARLQRFAGMRELNAGQQGLLADSQALLAWFGLQSLEQWRQLDFEQMRVYHEKFAAGFEQYLHEGVAPSLALARIFATLRQWLQAVYAKINNDHWPGLALTDEVRGVFDRMLATDEAIRRGLGGSETPTMDEGLGAD